MWYNARMEDTRYSTYEIRRRAVRAVHDGMVVVDVAKAYQAHRSTIHRWLARYDERDTDNGLQRKPGSGRPRIIGDLTSSGLLRIVLQPASAFGYETDFWTCGRLRHVIGEEFGVTPSQATVWRRLREAGLTYQKPERRYFEASEEQRQEWIKKDLPKIRRSVRRYKAVLYFQDESNISLTALLGKTWSPCGKTPIQRVTGKRGGVSAMSAINGRGRLIFTLHDKRIASDEVIHFLAQMLAHHKRRHVVVVMDQASPHTSKKTRLFVKQQKRLHVFYLPPYSPDWNPDEGVWNHLKHQELKGHQAKTKGDMKELAETKLAKMANDPRQLRGIFFRCYVADLLQ
jgi:transposase